jgi:hypothetical protein
LQVKQRFKIERHLKQNFKNSLHEDHVLANKSVSSMRHAELSFFVFQNRAYHCSQETQQKELFERQDVQIHNSVEHAE